MSDETIEYDGGVILEVSGAKSRIILNRPEKRNAISPGLEQAVHQALLRIDEDDDVKVVILKGNGPAFCAGADLDAIPAKEGDAPWFGTQERDVHNMMRYTRSGSVSKRPAGSWSQLWYFRKPTIAQVHGYCYAAGVQPAMNCDLVVAAEDALIGQPQLRAQGFIPDFAMWPLTVNPRILKRLFFTGDPVTGAEAAEIGMITKAVPAEELEEYTEWLAERIAAMPADMLSYGKLLLNSAYDIMGLPAMMREAAVFDVFGHFSEASETFGRLVQEGGVKAAIEWRDEAFGGPHRQGEQIERGPDNGKEHTL